MRTVVVSPYLYSVSIFHVSTFSGQKKVLQCLLEIRSFFSQSEPRYLLNQLYITDYCIWIQKVKDNKLISLADSLKKVWW